MKFGKLWSYGKQLDADFIATGHYARLETVYGEPQLLRAVDPEPERRVAVRLDRLAVAADQVRVRRVAVQVDQRAGGRSDAGHSPDPLEHGLRDGRVAAVRVVDELPAAHDRVGVAVGAGEDRVERLRDRVGQDEAAADHRDAEHDRQRRQDGADAAGEEALERNPGHWPATS